MLRAGVTLQRLVTDRQVGEFIALHGLPSKFHALIDQHYAPLVSWLMSRHRPRKALVLGINGAQGTGKSTLADFIQLACESAGSPRVAVLSLDDFYLTKAERRQRGDDIHPLLATRGVPGTHDLPMLSSCIERLRSLDAGESLSLPRFNKAQDERADPGNWPTATGPIELIILEGWCVGSPPQSNSALSVPINALERERDSACEWRRYVNDQLAGPYAQLFAQLDLMIFLQAPDFDSVRRWRFEQEQQLAAKTSSDGDDKIMNNADVADFIRYYERLTRFNLETLPSLADVTLVFDKNHDCVRSCYARSENDND